MAVGLSHMYMIVKSDEEIRSVEVAYPISERKKSPFNLSLGVAA